MTIKTYLIGFGTSLVLTFVAFMLVFNGQASMPLLITLALAQLVVQLVCFLHLTEAQSRNWLTFIFTLFILIVLVGGTLWIMQNLQAGHDDMDMMHDHLTPQTLDD